MRTLDRSKSYQEILGGTGLQRYEQNGIKYDVHGQEIVEEVVEKPKKRGHPPKKP